MPLDVKRIVADVMLETGIALEPGDPVIALAILNRRTLEVLAPAIGEIAGRAAAIEARKQVALAAERFEGQFEALINAGGDHLVKIHSAAADATVAAIRSASSEASGTVGKAMAGYAAILRRVELSAFAVLGSIGLVVVGVLISRFV